MRLADSRAPAGSRLMWWRKARSRAPEGATVHGGSGRFAWHPRLEDLKEPALSESAGALVALKTEASSMGPRRVRFTEGV